jgi:hypothetical protein
MEKKESNNDFFPFFVNMDIDSLLPKEKRISFQKSFAYLRKKLQIKLTRKTYIDSILKKCKARFFKAIYDCLRKVTKKGSIQKIPQNFIINISIENNKNIFEKSFQELYQEFNLSPINIEQFIDEGKCIKGKENYFRYIYSTKISELYILYTKSKRYNSEVEYIKDNLGLKMMLLYKFVAENFVNYYLFTKPHYCKNLKKKDENICESNNDSYVNKYINNINKNIKNNNIDFKSSTNSKNISLVIDNSKDNNLNSNKLNKIINLNDKQ